MQDGTDYNVNPTTNHAVVSISDNDTETGTEVTLIESSSPWKYLDDGSNQGTSWRNNEFNDAGWASGNAAMGFGDADLATTVGYGTDSNSKHITTYFRREFTVANAANYNGLTLDMRRDNGAVVYLNGEEVYRTNMPGGTVLHNTLAIDGIFGKGEKKLYRATLDPSLLINGTNVIAVEVHQNRPSSSDLVFDFKLTGTESNDPAPRCNARRCNG